MSLLPARMSRLLVGGHQQHLEAAIDTLHREGALHIEDYQDPTGTTHIGTPLEAGEQASADLVELRGLQKSLGTEGSAPGPAEADPRATMNQARAATAAAVESAQSARASHAALEAEAAALAPLAGLDADLGVLGSLRTVRAYIGTCRTDPTQRLQALAVPYELQAVPGPGGTAVLLVVVPSGAQAAERALTECGFQAAVLTKDRRGTPRQRLAELDAERRAASDAIAAHETRLAALRAEWGPRLAAAERALAGEVERTQAPLRFGVTASTFHIEGWVPRTHLARVQDALKARFGESVYVHDLGDAPRTVDAHAAHGGHATHGEGAKHPAHGGAAAAVPGGNKADQAGHDDGHHAPTAAEEPPIHLDNKGLAKPYEFLLGLLAKPRYREVDPTTLMLIFFPIFFGLMVGDLAIGLLIVGVGLFLKKNRVFGIGGPAVGRALVMGGVMSAVVGLFVFGEALGIHFVVSDEAAAEGELSWENILGVRFPTEGLIHKTVAAGHGGPAGDAAIAPHAEGTETAGLAGILAPHGTTHLSLAGIVNLGYYSKVHDTLALLVWSMVIGLVHVVLGLVIGIRNVYVQHGAKLAIQEKAAWLTLLAGFALAVLAWGGALGYVGVAIVVVSVALLWMGAAHTIGVGFIALLEVPGLAGNILSYTRLAAIGASKAGMAIAFASIAFETIGGGDVHSVLGWLVYLVGQMLILVLAIIAGTLQSLRLQFVEFFGKFYTGGGRPYLPFGRRAA